MELQHVKEIILRSDQNLKRSTSVEESHTGNNLELDLTGLVESIGKLYGLYLSIVIVNWEIFCWLAEDRLAHVHLSHCHLHVDLPSWFALSSFAPFGLMFV